MPYVEDDDGNHIVDDDGNKIFFSVSYEVDNITYVHREMLHIDYYYYKTLHNDQRPGSRKWHL